MNRLLKIALASTLVFGIATVSAQADVRKGQKIIIKKLKKDCGMNGAQMASKHTQDEWETINNDGKLQDEISNLCGGNNKPLKDAYLPHVYDFLYEYASDSGNVPSC